MRAERVPPLGERSRSRALRLASGFLKRVKQAQPNSARPTSSDRWRARGATWWSSTASSTPVCAPATCRAPPRPGLGKVCFGMGEAWSHVFKQLTTVFCFFFLRGGRFGGRVCRCCEVGCIGLNHRLLVGVKRGTNAGSLSWFEQTVERRWSQAGSGLVLTLAYFKTDTYGLQFSEIGESDPHFVWAPCKVLSNHV